MFTFHAKMFLDNYYLFVSSGVDKAPADPGCQRGGGQMYRILKFVVGSCRLDSVFLTGGSTLRDVGVTSPIIIGGRQVLNCAGGTRFLHHCVYPVHLMFLLY